MDNCFELTGDTARGPATVVLLSETRIPQSYVDPCVTPSSVITVKCKIKHAQFSLVTDRSSFDRSGSIPFFEDARKTFVWRY